MDFSEESLREILLSLPVKSLLRFKCVCKNWGNLINNRSFTIDHCNKKKPPQHLIYDYGATDDAPTVTLVSDKGIDEQKNFQRFGDNITNLLGSIDGVFFIERQIDNAILCTLWNPANREVRHLPAATIDFIPYNKHYRHLVFGLEPMTKDYKVLYYDPLKEYAAVYSGCRDSWRIFKHNLDVDVDENNIFEINSLKTTDYLNGYYYWLVRENNKCRIVSFDFGNEVFVDMEGPPAGHEDYHWLASLMLLGDSLGILNFVDGFVHDVWILGQSISNSNRGGQPEISQSMEAKLGPSRRRTKIDNKNGFMDRAAKEGNPKSPKLYGHTRNNTHSQSYMGIRATTHIHSPTSQNNGIPLTMQEL
ncbi:F-box protein At3g08750-like [Solanum tuberosum]|uniref:F-box protein At3g08750-like n=1 Tax=Solanum tuberosum TaxID=4113 RepID=UPI00073A23A5|nr:PREDICTED: F-box protein At3g08750-like [Solanum tuberosum]